MKLTLSFRFTWIIIAVAGLGLACQAETQIETVHTTTIQKQEAPVIRSARAMPDFTLQDLEGNDVRLSDHADKVVLVNFWATNCGPCRREMPDFVAIQKEYGGDMFTIIGISLDLGGEERVSRFVDDYELNFPIVMGNQKVVRDYGNIRGIPTSFLLNKDHELVGKRVGMVTREMLTPILDSLLRL